MDTGEKNAATGSQLSDAVKSVLAVIAGAALLTLSAKIQIPFWPVPMTLQTLAVLTMGAALGMRRVVNIVLLYLATGAIGLPVFASPSVGLAAFAGPTGGYLVGFLLAAFMTGKFSDLGYFRNGWTALIALVFGEVAIYMPGLTWLSALIGFEKSLAGGLYPFLPAEALKLGLAWTLLTATRSVGRH
jgi:biotin transport system substrate-specific component